MKKITFVFFILGMFVLAGFYFFDSEEIDELKDLENLEINSRVFVSGTVIDERFLYEGTKLLVLNNRIDLVCECSENFKGRKVFAEGIVQEYEGKRQVLVLSIFDGK